MNDLDDIVRASLAGAADDDVHVERLLAAARAGGLRRRRRWLVGRALAVAVTVAAVAVGTAVVLRPPAGEPEPAKGPSLPMGRIVPGAVSPLDDPGVMGTVPLLHLTLTEAPFQVSAVRYDTGSYPMAPGDIRLSESMTVEGTGGESINIAAGHDLYTVAPKGAIREVQVGGRKAQFSLYEQMDIKKRGQNITRSILLWNISDALTVRIISTLTDPAQVVAVAGHLRFDRAHLCGPAFRLPWAPPGLTPLRCELEFRGGEVSHTEFRYMGSGEQLILALDNAAMPSMRPSGMPGFATEDINGRAAWVTGQEHQARFNHGGAWIQVDAWTPEILRQVAGTIEPLGFDPDQWPL